MVSSQPHTERDSAGTPAVSKLIIASLLSRRSVSSKNLVEPGPNRTEIRQIIAAALTATDHCALRPWQFLSISGTALERLGDVFVAIKKRREPGASEAVLEQERLRAQRAPVLIAVIAKITPNHPRVPVYEQHASVGAAIQNMLLSAHALGYGAKMVSGRKVSEPELITALGLQSHEQLFGFICLGTPMRFTTAKARPNIDDHLDAWVPSVDRG